MPRIEVIVKQMVKVPFRALMEPVNKVITVYTRTSQQAIAAVRRAGIKGEIIGVRRK